MASAKAYGGMMAASAKRQQRMRQRRSGKIMASKAWRSEEAWRQLISISAKA